MKIRHATGFDFPKIMTIYDYARTQMRINNNPNQWHNNWPSEEVILEDIKNSNLYVIEDDGNIYGVFAFIIGDDPTYKVIENGQWLDDEPYGVIHRVASNGKKRKILKIVLEFCAKKISNIRIDTHIDNKIMQHLLEKYGYVKCGQIYVADKTMRLAYQKKV